MKGSVNAWLQREKSVPACYFDKVAKVNRFNLVLTNIFMATQALLFLRHFRGTTLGKMVSSVVACLKVFAYWAIIAVFVWIPYAFLQHNLRYPNRIVRNYDDNYRMENDTWIKYQSSTYRYRARHNVLFWHFT